MDVQPLRQVACLLRERDALDAKIAEVTGGPATSGYLAAWVASQVFDIELAGTGALPGTVGRFRSGPLRGHSVSVQWHPASPDAWTSTAPDHYLVLAGPPAAEPASRGVARPWGIDIVYLFDSRWLSPEREDGEVEPGRACEITPSQWRAAEVYPSARNRRYLVTPVQAALLQLFLVT